MNPEKKSITVYTEILSSTTVFNTDDNNKCFLSTKLSYDYDMISEGSCDTEDWSNDAENSDLPLRH